MRPLLLLLFTLAGCLKVPGTIEDFGAKQPRDKTPEAVLCGLHTLDEDTFCMPGERLERWMQEGQVRILDGRPTSSGVSGAMKVLVELVHPEAPEPLVFNAKWKPAAAAWNGLNNAPRKEIAAYEFQKLYLPEEDRVVPPSVMRCMPINPGSTVERRAGEKDLDCAWGLLSYWLNHLTAPGTIDWDQFETDAAYRRAIANLNIYMFLIKHGDAHSKNWLLTTGKGPVRAISIDNGISFGGPHNYKVQTNWNGLMVSQMPADIVDRLRTVSDGELADLLVVGRWQVEQRNFVYRGDGGLEKRPGQAWFYKRRSGLYMHGLKAGEVAGIRRRIKRLLRAIDSGRITTF